MGQHISPTLPPKPSAEEEEKEEEGGLWTDEFDGYLKMEEEMEGKPDVAEMSDTEANDESMPESNEHKFAAMKATNAINAVYTSGAEEAVFANKVYHAAMAGGAEKAMVAGNAKGAKFAKFAKGALRAKYAKNAMYAHFAENAEYAKHVPTTKAPTKKAESNRRVIG